MANNMAFKSQQTEAARTNGGAASKLLLEGSKGPKGVWGTEVRLRS